MSQPSVREESRWHVRVQAEDFDAGAELGALRAAAGRTTGAVACFVGLARDISEGFPVARITLEHYPGMTERGLQEIAEHALQRWSLLQVRVIHRYGELLPGDQIVFVAVASLHREAAFDACRFIMDYLKTQATFWKRESGSQGTRWVEARESDERARKSWESVPEKSKSAKR